MPGSFINEVNDVLSDLAKSEDLEFMDHSSNFCYKDGSVVENLLRDGLHLSDMGSKRYLDNIGLPVIEKDNDKPYKLVVPKAVQKKQQKKDKGKTSNKVPGANRNTGSTDSNNEVGRKKVTPKGTDQNKHPSTQKRCNKCAETGHKTKDCRHTIKVTCHSCNELGRKNKFCEFF